MTCAPCDVKEAASPICPTRFPTAPSTDSHWAADRKSRRIYALDRIDKALCVYSSQHCVRVAGRTETVENIRVGGQPQRGRRRLLGSPSSLPIRGRRPVDVLTVDMQASRQRGRTTHQAPACRGGFDAAAISLHDRVRSPLASRRQRQARDGACVGTAKNVT